MNGSSFASKVMSQLRLEMNRLRFKWRKKTLTRDKAPGYLTKSNVHIYDGFRAHKQGDTTLGCFFFWSNETLNIWTHLVGAAIFFYRLFQIVYQGLFPDPVDRMLIVAELFCLIYSVLSSATCHAFCHISEEVYRHYEKRDVLGIIVCTTAGFFNLSHFLLQCYPLTRYFYTLVVLLCSFFLVKAVNSKHSVFSKDNGNTLKRILAFTLWSLFALVPVVHWLYLEGSFSSPKVATFLPRILTIYGLGISAAVFFATQFPECTARGQYDYVGQSHQIWHILIFCCMYYWHLTLEALITYVNDNPCDSPQPSS